MTPFPQECPYCSSPRSGIQEGKGFYRCGSIAARVREGLRWARPVKCVLAAKEKSRLDESDATGEP